MRTTLLNPTVWLLLAVVLASAAGATRRLDAGRSLEIVLRWATTWPVLIGLTLLALGGLSTRIVLGYLSPGVYAEEVVSARAFLADRTLSGADARAEFAQWLAEAPAPQDPFTLPGITTCQADALANRPRFFTSQGHPPTLLLASVPVVGTLGGRGLYVVLALGSLAAMAMTATMLAAWAGVTSMSPLGILLGVALVGWQPVLAGVRQGDAVVLSAALSVAAWYLAGRSDARAGAASGVAVCLALPSIGVLPALLRCRPRSALLALCVVAAGAGLAVLFGGVLMFADFAQALAFSARTYAQAVPNYAVAGRLFAAGVPPIVLLVVLLAAAGLSLSRSRTPDAAFGVGLMLGLLAMPIIWSQHLVLTLVPLAVLLRRVLRGGSAAALACWALIALALSLPDPAVAMLSDWLPVGTPSAVVVPVIPAVMAILWAWLLLGSDRLHLRHACRPRRDDAPAVSRAAM